MKTFILLSCCKEKLDHAAPAANLYQSDNFKKALVFAGSLKPDCIFILSAKHHLVTLDQVLEPYDVCLSDKSAEEKREWAAMVASQLAEYGDLKKDMFILLASNDYTDELTKHLTFYSLPLAGLSHEEKTEWLERNTAEDKEPTMHSKKSDPGSFKSLTAMTYRAKDQLLRTGDTSLFDELFLAYPQDGMVHYRMAECLEKVGNLAEASEEYDKAEKLFPMQKYKAMARDGRKRVMNRLK